VQVEQYDEEGWSLNLKNNPSQLNFWFDFIEPSGELLSYSVPSIGSKTKVESSKDKVESVLPIKPLEI
jgi:hypothetical protein